MAKFRTFIVQRTEPEESRNMLYVCFALSSFSRGIFNLAKMSIPAHWKEAIFVANISRTNSFLLCSFPLLVCMKHGWHFLSLSLTAYFWQSDRFWRCQIPSIDRVEKDVAYYQTDYKCTWFDSDDPLLVNTVTGCWVEIWVKFERNDSKYRSKWRYVLGSSCFFISRYEFSCSVANLEFIEQPCLASNRAQDGTWIWSNFPFSTTDRKIIRRSARITK